jgi:hypothetical protein
MLVIPQEGAAPSTDAVPHKCNLIYFCDWLESSLLFTGTKEISYADLTDIFLESHLYSDTDLAYEFVGNIASELKRRNACIGSNYPIEFKQKSFSRKKNWEEVLAYSYCLLVSMTYLYPAWYKTFQKDYATQGELFEKIAEAAIAKIFSGWGIYRTGWAPGAANTASKKIGLVAEAIGEPLHPSIASYLSSHAKDAKTDIVCFKRFIDKRRGSPIFLAQCASGKDWINKLGAPKREKWEKLIEFLHAPATLMTIPFTITEEVLIQRTPDQGGLILDRVRLLQDYLDDGVWISKNLSKELNSFLKNRISKIPAIA